MSLEPTPQTGPPDLYQREKEENGITWSDYPKYII